MLKSLRPWMGLLLSAGLWTGCTVLVDPGHVPKPDLTVDLADPVLNRRRVFVVGTLTSASAAETVRQLLHLDAQSSEPIDLFLMTPGGDLKAAFAVEHAFQMIRSKVNTVALGECNSGGAVLLAAGTGERRAFPDSVIVVHGMVPKNHPPARYTELTQEAYTDFWHRCARLPESWLPLPQGRVFVLSAREALEYGLIDRIEARPDGTNAVPSATSPETSAGR